MIELWDYFMRRKQLLLAIAAVFWASSTLSYHVLTSNASEREIPYISIESWGEEVEVPRTGGETEPIVLAILDADAVTNLENTQSDQEKLSDKAKKGDLQSNQEELETKEQSAGDDLQGEVTQDENIMSDEVLERTVESLRNHEEIQTEYIELVSDNPAQEEDFSMVNGVLLAVAVVIVLTSGVYFTYQHFMR